MGLKIVLLGDADVGKTSLILRYTQNFFSPEYKQSLGASFAVKDLMVHDQPVKMVIWDIAGQPSFRQVRRHYYRGAHAALLVFDVTAPSTFMTLLNWINEFHQVVPRSPIILVGNRMDPNKKRLVPIQAAKMIERQWSTPYIETDIITGKGVEKVFSEVVSIALGRMLSGSIQ